MIVKKEMSLSEFKANGVAACTLEKIKRQGKINDFEIALEKEYADGISEAELNDLLRYDSDTIFEWLGIRTYDEILEDLNSAKDALEDLQDEYERDKESLKEEETSFGSSCLEVKRKINRLYDGYYKGEIEGLRKEIDELKSELKLAQFGFDEQ